MKTKQIIFAILICLMCAFAIITAVMGQSETQIIQIEENNPPIIEEPVIEETLPPQVIEPEMEIPATNTPIEIDNSTTTEYATTTE